VAQNYSEVLEITSRVSEKLEEIRQYVAEIQDFSRNIGCVRTYPRAEVIQDRLLSLQTQIEFLDSEVRNIIG
jgi:hypothetical protein